jgi:hypothetical protein
VPPRVRTTLPPGASVKDDWRAWLPPEKSEVFGAYGRQLEAAYSMFSISLNEAMELRHAGQLAKSCQTLDVTSALCSLLTNPLAALLRALGEHAKHYGTIPNAAPLDPANFQGTKDQRKARLSSLLSRVLLSQRSQFLNKVRTLQEMVEDLGQEFRSEAEELTSGVAIQPALHWEELDAVHYDVNTCLREAMVLLKSFLLVLPDGEIAAFQKSVGTQLRVPECTVPSRERLVGHRRMAAIGGE